MEVITSPSAMREWSGSRRATGRTIGFVPTMGALHDGHASLIDASRERDDATVLSIFVNPLQFNVASDFENYPRTREADLEVAHDRGVSAVYVPSAHDMYPAASDTVVTPGRVAAPMEGSSRPGHFVGVATVVTKLFNTVDPHRAYFGMKDYQQLAVIRRMTADLDFGVQIVGVPTVREPDGLAMSSRNVRLSAEDRTAAPVVHQALCHAARAHADGATTAADIAHAASTHLASEPRCRTEYVTVADAATLEPLAVVDRPAVVCIAAWFGEVRLIDNLELQP